MENSPSSSPEPQSLSELHAENARELCAMFMGLAKLGAEMVQIITERAREEAYAPAGTPTQLPELVTAHDVMMRSLRRTGLLIQKLTKPAPAPREAGRSGDGARPRSGGRSADSLDLETLEDVERLSDADLELLERLDDIAHRPLGEIIGGILKDFGVPALDSVDRYLRLTPTEIAFRCSEAARAAAEPAGTGDCGDDGVRADAMRRNGATGCRDP